MDVFLGSASEANLRYSTKLLNDPAAKIYRDFYCASLSHQIKTIEIKWLSVFKSIDSDLADARVREIVQGGVLQWEKEADR